MRPMHKARMHRHPHGHWHLHRQFHRRLHRRFRHSLGARLTLIFVLLAGAAGLAIYLAVQQQVSWVTALAGVALLTLFAHGIVRHLLRPLRALAYGAAVFGKGEFGHRIPVHHRDEIGELACRFNRMADDIQAMLDAKRELLLAISHELRSPLTRARLNAELIDSQGPEQAAVVKELGFMRDLIEDLLERERLDSGHGALRQEDCDVRALIEDLLDARFQQAVSEGRMQVQIGGDLPETLRLDAARVKVLLGNLIDNGLRHHDDKQGPMLLSVGMDASTRNAPKVVFVVRDKGPGVPEDALARLGEPFFRPDSSRTRASGGVGLGLNLCRLIAQAHGGTLQLRNAEPGLEARVVLPAQQRGVG